MFGTALAALKMTLASKVVKSDLKIIISIHQSKSVTQKQSSGAENIEDAFKLKGQP